MDEGYHTAPKYFIFERIPIFEMSEQWTYLYYEITFRVDRSLSKVSILVTVAGDTGTRNCRRWYSYSCTACTWCQFWCWTAYYVLEMRYRARRVCRSCSSCLPLCLPLMLASSSPCSSPRLKITVFVVAPQACLTRRLASSSPCSSSRFKLAVLVVSAVTHSCHSYCLSVGSVSIM